jgi:hypothetical protein
VRQARPQLDITSRYAEKSRRRGAANLAVSLLADFLRAATVQRAVPPIAASTQRLRTPRKRGDALPDRRSAAKKPRTRDACHAGTSRRQRAYSSLAAGEIQRGAEAFETTRIEPYRAVNERSAARRLERCNSTETNSENNLPCHSRAQGNKVAPMIIINHDR